MPFLGIQQDWVDGADTFVDVFRRFQLWWQQLIQSGKITESNFVFVTCGEWDLKTMLPLQCATSAVANLPIFSKWTNVKFAFQDFYSRKALGMTEMLDDLGLALQGRHHSGIDDCRNIARIVVRMAQDGCVFDYTSPSTLVGRPMMAKKGPPKETPQKFEYFCIIDFEATCDRDVKVDPMEIIEFPAVLFNTRTLAIEAEFHAYVRPVVHTILTPFASR